MSREVKFAGENGSTGVWAAWNKFWFTPADPTPLCFMRIVAGILTLYVHIAYTFDLVDFFGPHAWCDHQYCNEHRVGFPHLKPQNDWKQEVPPFIMPPDPTQRRAVSAFVSRALTDNDFDRTIQFMYSLGVAGEERNEILRYLRDVLPAEPGLRDQVLKPFIDGKLSPEDLERLPRYFQRQVTPESRQHFASELVNFAKLLPTEDKLRRVTLDLFLETNPESWVALQDFIRKMSKLSPQERELELEYQAVWQVPSDMVYSKGMPTFSPWFHVTDIRWLWTIHGLNLFIIILFTLGMYTRVTSVMTWLVGLSYINRAQPYLFGQDTMMNLCLLYLMFSPCGAKWSLDRYMARKQAEARGEKLPPVEPSVSAGFVLRVFQIQYCLMYLSAGLSKLKGTSWWNGTALFGCLANAEFSPMHVAEYQQFLHWLCSHRFIWEIFLSGAAALTLLTEIPFPYVVWTPMRPVMVASSLLLHTGISILMGLSVFSLFMFTLAICWIPADAINWMFQPAES